MELESVILAGDSAGGHLALCIAQLAVLRGFRRPDAIFSHYPALSVDLQRFFPSLLMSVDEELLSQPFMQFALSCFTRNGGKADSNPLMSPIYCPDEMLRQLPPVKFMTAEVDALRDQALIFALKMLKVGNKCEIYFMKDHIHGFCNIDTNYVGVNEYRRTTTLTEQLFRE